MRSTHDSITIQSSLFATADTTCPAQVQVKLKSKYNTIQYVLCKMQR